MTSRWVGRFLGLMLSAADGEPEQVGPGRQPLCMFVGTHAGFRYGCSAWSLCIHVPTMLDGLFFSNAFALAWLPRFLELRIRG